MAQAEGAHLTNLGIGELAALIAEGSATGLQSIQCLEGACDEDTIDSSTFANPGGATKLTASGLTIVDADTVVVSTTTITNDTVELDHVFTASDSELVTGFACYNNDDDVTIAAACFAAGVAMESDDTLTCELKMKVVDSTT